MKNVVNHRNKIQIICAILGLTIISGDALNANEALLGIKPTLLGSIVSVLYFMALCSFILILNRYSRNKKRYIILSTLVFLVMLTIAAVSFDFLGDETLYFLFPFSLFLCPLYGMLEPVTRCINLCLEIKLDIFVYAGVFYIAINCLNILTYVRVRQSKGEAG